MITSNHSKLSSVRNPDGLWINTSMFQEEAIHFKKNGYYCPDPWGSPAWKEYWTEQQKRCVEGYEVGGVKITGHHYNYLNFTQIKKTEIISGNVGKKILGFPDFWDGDYNYFWCLEIARHGATPEFVKQLNLSIKPSSLDGGKHMIVGKARRKGYSYKNGSVCANVYNTQRNSLILIGAFVKDYLYPNGTMQMASDYLNFYNEHTGWAKKRDYVDKVDERKASFKKYQDGMPIEAGYHSTIKAITFKDNPDAARGKDAALLLFEEAGKFPNLQDSYEATEATLRSGRFITGQLLIFGTGGDMEKATVDFANMFYNPDLFQLMRFENIWDENSEASECGFFHPFFWNNDGYYDKNGNSDVQTAIADEQKEREKLLKKSAGSKVLEGRVQEYPMNPSEAFLTVSHNSFPVIELRNRLNKLIKEELHFKIGQAGKLYRNENGDVKFSPDLTGELIPIWNRKPSTEDKTGAVIIYEYPVSGAPKGLYKIGYDPYAMDNGESLGAIYVYKGTHKYSFTRETIVATYVGRPGEPDAMNKVFEMLCELYNTQGMYENMVYHVKSYFTRRKKLHLLAAQPDQVISKSIKASGVQRVYGCHMNETLKDAGERYISQWLTEERDMDEQGNILTNIDFIYDPGLLEELILYNKKGNYDRVIALMMVLIQCQEEELGKEYDNKDTTKFTDLINLSENLFKKNR
jgi:hypothetical protein